MILGNQLNWKEHVKHLTRKLARGSWTISKLKKYVDAKTQMLVHFSLIYSQLQYCITSWGSAPKTVLKPLKVIQNGVVRMITESHFRTHSSPLYYQLNISKLKYVYKFKLSKLIHNNLSDPNFRQIKSLVDLKQMHHHCTRHSEKSNFFIPKARTNLGKTTISFAGPRMWTEVPQELKTPAKYKFKKLYHHHLVHQYV